MTLGKHLYALRTSRSLALREVAAAIDIDPVHLGEVERDRVSPTRETLTALAKHYNVTEVELRKEAAGEVRIPNAPELLEAVKLAYRKHYLGDDIIGWGELSEKLMNALCEAMDDEAFQAWIEPYGESQEDRMSALRLDGAALREGLAEYAHEAWSGWVRYMFEKSYEARDGRVEIPPELAERWTRQMNTPFADLPESEKESDRLEADRMIEVMDKTPLEQPTL